MHNYQLYGTNCKLGGQVKWNLTIESVNNVLEITDFKLTPVSDNIPYLPIFDNNIFNTSHISNLKSMYDVYKSNFYRHGLDPLYTSTSPYIKGSTPRHQYKQPYDDSLDAGFKRVSVQKYGKPYSLFCPVWLEDFCENDTLRFDLIVVMKNADGSDMETVAKSLELKPTTTYQSKFVSYFNQYINDVSVDGCVNDKMLNIDLEDDNSFINGIDVENGLMVNSRKLSLKNTLLSTERLMMDVDSIILDKYEDNHMIAPQIINFNFLFDIDDFILPVLLEGMWGSYINMRVRTYVKKGSGNYEELEVKALHTNYDFIERKFIKGDKPLNISKDDINVFNLLKDDMAVELMKKKPTQEIVHWALRGNNDYTFNLYSSFGGIIPKTMTNDGATTTNYSVHPSLYQNAPNIWDKNDVDAGLRWCNAHYPTNGFEVSDFKSNIANYYKDFSTINTEWCNSLKYKTINGKQYHLILMIYPTSLLPHIQNEYTLNTITIGTKSISCYMIGDYCIVFTQESQVADCIFVNFREILNDGIISHNSTADRSDEYVDCITVLRDWMNNVIEPMTYTLPMLKYGFANSPDEKCSELEYYKSEDYSRIIRYDGYITPQFVDLVDNNKYIKRHILPNDETFNIYSTSGFDRLYPSIQFYAWLKCDKSDDLWSNEMTDISSMVPYEFSWFDKPYVLALRKSLLVQLNNVKVDKTLDLPYKYNGVSYQSIKDILLLEIQKIYNVDVDMSLYIYNQYDVDLQWDYSRNDSVEYYTYTLTCNLK